jgi:hypothetical protein
MEKLENYPNMIQVSAGLREAKYREVETTAPAGFDKVY